MLLVTAGLTWWTGRGLPHGTWRIARAAVTADRPLTLTYLTLGVCAVLFAVVAVSGLAILAGLVWFALGVLGWVALTVGLARRRRRRRTR